MQLYRHSSWKTALTRTYIDRAAYTFDPHRYAIRSHNFINISIPTFDRQTRPRLKIWASLLSITMQLLRIIVLVTEILLPGDAMHQKFWPSYTERRFRIRSPSYHWKFDECTRTCTVATAVKRKGACKIPPSTPVVGKTGDSRTMPLTPSPKFAVASEAVRPVASIWSGGRGRGTSRKCWATTVSRIAAMDSKFLTPKNVEIFLETLKSPVLADQ